MRLIIDLSKSRFTNAIDRNISRRLFTDSKLAVDTTGNDFNFM